MGGSGREDMNEGRSMEYIFRRRDGQLMKKAMAYGDGRKAGVVRRTVNNSLSTRHMAYLGIGASSRGRKTLSGEKKQQTKTQSKLAVTA